MPYNLANGGIAPIPVSSLIQYSLNNQTKTMSPISNNQQTLNNNTNKNNAGGTNQQQQQQQKNPKLYKTELCRSWMEHGRCNYGERCQYAHGEKEKRPVPRHPKYKTEACQSYHKTGYCPYGPRCHFVHNESPAQLKILIEQNEKALTMVQEMTSSPMNGRPLMVSSSSISLGNFTNLHDGSLLHKNNSVHTFPNNQFLGRAQSFGNSPAPPDNFIPFRQQQPIELFNGMSDWDNKGQENIWNGHNQKGQISKAENHWVPSFDPLRYHSQLHQMPTDQALSHQQFNGNQFIPTATVSIESAAPPLMMTMAQSDQIGNSKMDKQNGLSKQTKEQQMAQKLLGNLCSSSSDDDEYSRSSIIDSGTGSPAATFYDAVSDTSTASKQLFKQQQQQKKLVLMDNEEKQQRRSSDGDTITTEKVDVTDTMPSTSSSSLTSLLSSSSLSHHKLVAESTPNPINSPLPPPNKQCNIRLPVFERLSLNQ